MDRSEVLRRRVAVLFEPTSIVSHHAFQGVADYARHHHWLLFSVFARSGLEPLTSVTGWRGDGIIASVETQDMADHLHATGLPTVSYASSTGALLVPQVMSDNVAVGKLAASYFLERGYRHFAYFGRPDTWWSQQRGAGFSQALRECGSSCKCSWMREPTRRRGAWERRQKMIMEWLAALPKPIGVLACADPQARHLSEACAHQGIVVPDDVAILGVDNDDVVCEFMEPTLSSIDTGMVQVGYEAAALLDRLMAGDRPPKKNILIPPGKVVSRESTDFLAIEDEVVAEAMRVIESLSNTIIGVDDVVEHVRLGRRALERRFSETLGRSPAEEIRRAHVRRAKRVLTETKLPLIGVAVASGFRDSKGLCCIFRRIVGMTPTTWRKQTQV